MRPLPEKLSALIRLALADLAKVVPYTRRKKKFKDNMRLKKEGM